MVRGRVVVFLCCAAAALLPLLKWFGVLDLEAAFLILIALWLLSSYVLR